MALTSGARLGPYEIVSALGAGGMGEVYRARDTKLNRSVAIKVLPDLFATDTERLARFTREAQTLGALNHPHIAQIYGLEESGGVRALVMELVEGEDLSQRIARGPIPLDEALPIAKQVAEALEAAHEQGIIHRDLKPANIRVRPDGTVKVLDFGLALAPARDITSSSPGALANSPTVASPAKTLHGMILGTAAYMSPEQAKGRVVDKRTDIWAFGCVLYEMLSGAKAFDGEDVTDTIVAIMSQEPDWTRLPPNLPDPVTRMLRRCLEKEARRRLRDIGDARLELEGSAQETVKPSAFAFLEHSRWQRAREYGGWAVAIVAVLAMMLPSGPTPEAIPGPVARFELEAPLTTSGGDFGGALSPDGRLLVFQTSNVAAEGAAAYLRRMDGNQFARIAGTEGARAVAWSPDSQSLAFATVGEVRVFSINTRNSRLVARLDPTLAVRSLAWGSRGEIIVATRAGPLLVVRSGRDEAEPLWSLDASVAEVEHRSPVWLPDGRRVFFVSMRRTGTSNVPVLRSLDDDRTQELPNFQGRIVWAGDRHIVFIRGASIMAHRIRYDALALEGEPILLAGDGLNTAGLALGFAVASPTTLVYRTNVDEGQQFTWFGRDGGGAQPIGPPGLYPTFALSDDGTRLALSRREGGSIRIWVMDAVKGTMSRVTMDNTSDTDPRFSPDGRSIIFASFRDATRSPFQIAIAGSPEPQLVFKFTGTMFANDDWTRDGKWLLYHDAGLPALVATPLERPGDPPITVAKALAGVVDQASMSPDGKFVIYSSTESGRSEIYLVRFPPTGDRWQVSPAGGTQPTWRGDGREVYYLAIDRKLMAVPLRTADPVNIGDPVSLFVAPLREVSVGSEQYAPSPDGKRFLISVPEAGATPNRFAVLVNWQQLLASTP